MSSQGGAILIGGTAVLTLDSDMLSGNQAVGDANGNALGGAVYNGAGASLTVTNTSFVNNQTNGANDSLGGADCQRRHLGHQWGHLYRQYRSGQHGRGPPR